MRLNAGVALLAVWSQACFASAGGDTGKTALPPKLKSSDTVFVYWNLAPLMPGELGELLTHVGLYHASVSFFSTQRKQSSFVQFVAPSFGVPLLFPNLSTGFSDDCKDAASWKKSLSWNNTGHVMFVDEAHTGYDWKHQSLVATINGTVYNSLHAWIEEAADRYTEYYLFHAVTDQFEEYDGREAGSGHGGIPIDDAKAPSGLSASRCQTRCTNDLRCDCVTMDSNGTCFKRALCNPSSFARKTHYATWVKREVDTGYKALTCMDFARLVLTQIYSFAGPCVFDQQSDGIIVDDPILHVRGQPILVNPTSNPEALESFCNYYNRMNRIKKGISGSFVQKIVGLTALLEELALDRAILHHGDQYYSFQPMFPYISYRKRIVPLPGNGECVNAKGSVGATTPSEELTLV